VRDLVINLDTDKSVVGHRVQAHWDPSRPLAPLLGTIAVCITDPPEPKNVRSKVIPPGRHHCAT
jgi:hypothetical protein